jgi:dTDP-glucose pyrophosphorylase
MTPLSATTVIITMAGEGSRFRDAGYVVPKYEIEANGHTLFWWSMNSLRSFADAGCQFIFVARNRSNSYEFLAAECKASGIDRFRLVTVDHLTDGQATTALLADPEGAARRQPVAIYNIDTWIDPRALDTTTIGGAGWIPCFPGEGDKWSFAAADETGRVWELREKKRISNRATAGLYWFDSFERYADVYDRYYSNPQNLEARERYVAPLYNQVIRDGGAVFVQDLPLAAVCPLGTPEDVELFKKGAAHATAPAAL